VLLFHLLFQELPEVFADASLLVFFELVVEHLPILVQEGCVIVTVLGGFRWRFVLLGGAITLLLTKTQEHLPHRGLDLDFGIVAHYCELFFHMRKSFLVLAVVFLAVWAQDEAEPEGLPFPSFYHTTLDINAEAYEISRTCSDMKMVPITFNGRAAFRWSRTST
jgi:hypothetical protein